MKIRLFAAFLFCALLAAQSFAAFQMTTINGSTGLVKMPTAKVLSPRDWNIAVDYVFDNPQNPSITSISDLIGNWVYKMNVGADMGHNNGLELGFVGRTEKVTNRFKEGVFINLKYALNSSDDPDDLSLAIGVENLTSSSESDAYMVASKYWKNGLGLHFGAMFDFPSNNKFRPLGMVGTNFPLGDKHLNVMGELFAGESVFQVNAGVSYSFSKAFSIVARGVNVTNNPSAKDAQYYSAGFCIVSPF